MKLCDGCGAWDMKPGDRCKQCAKPFSDLHHVYPVGTPLGGLQDGNYRAGPKTGRQARDDT